MTEPASRYVALPASAKSLPPDATPVGPLEPDEPIAVTVVVRPRRAAASPAAGPGDRQLSREEYAAAYGADPADLAAVERFARAAGLTVAGVDPAARTLRLTGPAATVSAAFQVELAGYQRAGVRYRGRSGTVSVPAELAEVIEAVLGLDDRPAADTRLRRSASVGTSFTPLELAALYDFPGGSDGTGQTIGIIELGGGYRAADLSAYFAGLGVAEPTVTAVPVDGAANAPTGDPNGPDGEVLLDIEVAGAIAPGAAIVVYFAPNTDSGFLDAINAAVHDTTHRPSIISISWGGPEVSWTAQSMRAYDDAFAAAGAMGVTVFAAAGDSGSSDGVNDGTPHVDFPASSPHVIGCGGTTLRASGGVVSSETVWNDGPGRGATGGGVSTVFPQPSWQTVAVPAAPTPAGGRGVPDLAAVADPQTGYRVRIDGVDTVIGGTSAVAPLLSGLVARCNASLGRQLGFLAPALYALPGSSGALFDITQGSNGAYSAGPGWDPCTGLGRPIGTPLLAALGTGLPPAAGGTP